ncbi:MAG: hypothetical protein ACLPWS_11615 [Rhodomicrobium sp.]
MPKRVALTLSAVSIDDIPAYHQDAVAALRHFLSPANTNLPLRLVGQPLAAVLAERLAETDLRSALAILVRLEAAFRVDFLLRCQKRKRDPLSRAFRDVEKEKGSKIRLEDDIFVTWRRERPETGRLISELVDAFKFRHHLAHGSYWQPKLGRKYDYQGIYILADSVLTNFKFVWAET